MGEMTKMFQPKKTGHGHLCHCKN